MDVGSGEKGRYGVVGYGDDEKRRQGSGGGAGVGSVGFGEESG